MPRSTNRTCCHALDKCVLVHRSLLCANLLRRLLRSARTAGSFMIGTAKVLSKTLITTTKFTKSTKASNLKLRALRDLRGIRILTDETCDRQNLVAASIACRLYSKLCSRVQESIGNHWMHPGRERCSFSMVSQSLAAGCVAVIQSASSPVLLSPCRLTHWGGRTRYRSTAAREFME